MGGDSPKLSEKGFEPPSDGDSLEIMFRQLFLDLDELWKKNDTHVGRDMAIDKDLRSNDENIPRPNVFLRPSPQEDFRQPENPRKDIPQEGSPEEEFSPDGSLGGVEE